MHTVYDKDGNAVEYKNKVDAQQMVNKGLYCWEAPGGKAKAKPAKSKPAKAKKAKRKSK